MFARRLMALAGSAVSASTASRFILVGAVGAVLDFAVLEALMAAGQPLFFAHIASFFCATSLAFALNSRWTFAATREWAAEPGWRIYARLIAVALMAIFLRGGVLALALDVWHWPQTMALMLGILAACLVNYFGSAFYIFSPSGLGISPSVRWRVASVGVVTYAVLLRLVYMRTLNLIPEEAYYWNYAQHIDYGYLDHPPMTAWLIWLATSVFGTNEFSVRIWALILWAVTAAFCFQLTKNLFGKTSAFVALILLSAMPYFFATGFLMTPDAPLAAAWSGTLYFLERSLLSGQKKSWLGVGLCLGLGMLSKYTIVLLGPALLIFMLVDENSRKWFREPRLYGAALIALILFMPVLLWNATHEWASFEFQSTRRIGEPHHFSLHALIGSMIALLSPIGLVAAYLAVAPQGGRLNGWRRGVTNRKWLFTAVFTLFPLSIFAAFSLFHDVKLNWTGPLWLAALPAIAAMASDSNRLPNFARMKLVGLDLSGPKLRAHWAATIVALLIIFGGAFHYTAVGLPGVPYKPGTYMNNFPIAWREFGALAQKIKNDVQGQDKREPLMVGLDRYFIASELAFYNAHSNGPLESAGSSLFGDESLMYNYWFPSADQNGRTMVMFSFQARQLSRSTTVSHFASVGPVMTETITRDGVNVATFYYRVGYDYRARTPAAAKFSQPRGSAGAAALPL